METSRTGTDDVNAFSTTASMSRGQFFSRGAKGGAALLVAGTALGQFVDTASADPLPTGDLAYARLLVGTELLASTFYSQALAASATGRKVTNYMKRAYANEQDHYQSVAGILTGAGFIPASGTDIDFSFPRGTFETEGSIVKFAQQLENMILGTYLGAVGAVQTAPIRIGLAQIAACEAQHAGYFTSVKGGKAFSLAFPPALTIDQASNALDLYTA
jgi:hypothetical protein